MGPAPPGLDTGGGRAATPTRLYSRSASPGAIQRIADPERKVRSLVAQGADDTCPCQQRLKGPAKSRAFSFLRGKKESAGTM